VASLNIDKDMYLLIQDTYLEFFKNNTPVKSGQMKREWDIEKTGEYSWRIYNPTSYAVFLEYGTGIYGPKHKMITPVNKKALRWFVGNKPFFARQVKGIKPLLLINKALMSTDLKKNFDEKLKKILIENMF